MTKMCQIFTCIYVHVKCMLTPGVRMALLWSENGHIFPYPRLSRVSEGLIIGVVDKCVWFVPDYV